MRNFVKLKHDDKNSNPMVHSAADERGSHHLAFEAPLSLCPAHAACWGFILTLLPLQYNTCE